MAPAGELMVDLYPQSLRVSGGAISVKANVLADERVRL